MTPDFARNPPRPATAAELVAQSHKPWRRRHEAKRKLDAAFEHRHRQLVAQSRKLRSVGTSEARR
jgi:hypothetical protein